MDRILKLKLRFSKCTVIMGRDHGHPYILSTTVLSDQNYFMGIGMGKPVCPLICICHKFSYRVFRSACTEGNRNFYSMFIDESDIFM